MNWSRYPLSFALVGGPGGGLGMCSCTEHSSRESIGLCGGFRLCFSRFVCEVIGKGSCKKILLALMKCPGCQRELLVGESDLHTGPVIISPATVFLSVGEKEQTF